MHNIKVSIYESCVHPDTSSSLSSVWVRIHGIPTKAKKEKYIKLISQAIGKFVCVDESSLGGQGPMRVMILYPDPSKIDCTLPTLYFGSVGKMLTLELERDQAGGGHSPAPDPPADQRDPQGGRLIQ